MSGDDLTRDLFAWLNQVKADGELPASAFKAAFEIGQWVNGEEFERSAVLLAWPSLNTIAERIAMCERTVRDMVRRVASRGHLTIETGHGPGHSSRYTLVLQNRQATASLNRNAAAGLEGDKQAKTGRRLHENRQAASERTGRRLPTNYLKEPSEEPSEDIDRRGLFGSEEGLPRKSKANGRASPEAEAAFEEFYRQFPRHVGKDAARRTYERVIKTGKATHAELLQGAMRYGAERAGEDPKWTKHPATWLNGGHWADEPAAQGAMNSGRADDSARPAAQRAGGSWMDISLAGMRDR